MCYMVTGQDLVCVHPTGTWLEWLSGFVHTGDALSASIHITTVFFFCIKSTRFPDKRKSPVLLTAVVYYLQHDIDLKLIPLLR